MLVTYKIVHLTYAVVLALLVMFEMNLGHLCVLLFVVSVQVAGIVLFQGCPLSQMKRVLSQKKKRRLLQQCCIGFHCNHEYESQIQTMVQLWLMISLKMFTLMLVKTIQLFLYV